MAKKVAVAAALAVFSGAAGAVAVTPPQAMIAAWTNGVYEGHVSAPIVEYVEDGLTKYRVDSLDWTREDDFRITLGSVLDPDPYITASIGVTDFGAPTTFTFSWSTPIVPTGPATLVRATIGGSILTADTGITFTEANPHAAAAFSTFVSDGVTTIHSVPGLALGPDVVDPFAPAAVPIPYFYSSAGYPAFIGGPAGTWTTLGMALGFALGGADDSASFTLYSEIVAAPVPLPGAALLLASGLLGFGVLGRREAPRR